MHAHPDRVQQVRHLLGPEVMALAWTKAGQPRHPLYIKGDTVPQPWAP
jgi:hypothetical protein